jgi:hypothetical protein
MVDPQKTFKPFKQQLTKTRKFETRTEINGETKLDIRVK